MAGIDFIHQNGVDYEIVPEIAPLFKTTVAYHTGDHVIYEAGWYTFKADKSAGAWDATKVNGPFKVSEQLTNLKEDFNAMSSATPSDVGKALKVKTVTDGKVAEWEFGETGGASQDNYVEKTYSVWLSGAISTSNGDHTSNNKRIRTRSFITNEKINAVRSLTGYEFLVHAYNLNGTYVGALKTDGTFGTGDTNLAWITEYTLAPNYYYLFVLRSATSPTSNISVDVGTNFLFGVFVLETSEDNVSAYDFISMSHDLVDYGYKGIDNINETIDKYTGITVKRIGMRFFLNGTATRNTVIIVNGSLYTEQATAQYIGSLKGIPLLANHTYKAELTLLSGNATHSTGLTPSVSAYKQGTTSTSGTGIRQNGNFARSFTAENANYAFCIYINNGTVMTNAEYLLTIKDTTYSSFPDTVCATQIYHDRGLKGMQGACTDGEYIYCARNNLNQFVKYNISDRSYTTTPYASTEIKDYHNNDFTYNPTTGKLYVAVMDSGKLAVVDPETMTVESVSVLLDGDGNALEFNGIAYDRTNNRYIVAVGSTTDTSLGFAFYDASFNFVSYVVCNVTYWTTIQGLETDGKFLYRTMGLRDSNQIMIFDFNGNLVKTIAIPLASNNYEPETAMYDWLGNWYLNVNTLGATDGSFMYLIMNTELEGYEIAKLVSLLMPNN